MTTGSIGANFCKFKKQDSRETQKSCLNIMDLIKKRQLFRLTTIQVNHKEVLLVLYFFDDEEYLHFIAVFIKFCHSTVRINDIRTDKVALFV